MAASPRNLREAVGTGKDAAREGKELDNKNDETMRPRIQLKHACINECEEEKMGPKVPPHFSG